MKKLSTRLASIGGLVVLGVCAIALAQLDSRNRERAPLGPIVPDSQPSSPIQVAGEWTHPESSGGFDQPQPVVRANNDASHSYHLGDSENLSNTNAMEMALPRLGDLPSEPSAAVSSGDLQQLAAEFENAGHDGQRIQATLVAGQIPAQPPGWLQGNAQSAEPADSGNPNSIGAPPQTPTTASGDPAGDSQLPNLPQAQPSQSVPSVANSGLDGTLPNAQALPSFPLTRGNTGANPAARAPQTRTNSPIVSRGISDMSDTQRGPMPATVVSPHGGATDPYSAGQIRSVTEADATEGPRTLSPSQGLRSNTFPSAPNVADAANPGATFSQAAPRTSGALNSPDASGPGVASPGAVTRSTIQQNSEAGLYGDPASSSAGLPSAGSMPAYGDQSQTGMPHVGHAQARISQATVSLVSGRPGNRYLDGTQNPTLVIEKRAPDEIQVGKAATFVIGVRNTGNSVAHDVTVIDSIPKGARFMDSVPAVRPDATGLLTWKLNEIAAGEERTITLQIVPEVQGELGSVATVQFAAQASVRTVATLPKLELVLQSQPEVLIGDVHQVMVTVQNTGTGVARGVTLEADIPPQLKHASGNAQLEAVLGDLRPNESKRIELAAAAVQPGASICEVRAISDDGINAAQQVNVEVTAPKLVASIEGPKVRYLDRQATYHITVENVGTAMATNLAFQARLPAGLKFNAADVHGQYIPETHSVSWGLEELSPGQPAPIEITVLPVELGPQVITFSAGADLGVSTEAKSQLTVNGLADLSFTIAQDDGTIEAGATSTYSVEVTNTGTKPDKNVRLAIELPAGAELVAVVNAPVEYRASGNRVEFAPIAEMRNRDQYSYRFQIRHTQPGVQIVRAQLISENSPKPVIKEEDTLVYNDQS